MKKFNVFIPVHATIVYALEAKTEKEAIEKAKDMAKNHKFCPSCSDEFEIEFINNNYPITTSEILHE